MRILLTLTMVLIWFAFGWVLSATVNYKDDLLWLASPLAILASASITLLVASIGWMKSKNSETTNRTISYLQEKFPLSDNRSAALGHAQQKMIEKSSNFAVRDQERNLVNFHLDIYEETLNSLTEEEVETIEYLSDVFEVICLNIKHGYFDVDVIKSHLGEDFGVQFWMTSWPHIEYCNAIQQLYLNAKGLSFQNESGVYSAYRQYIYSCKLIENKYPLYGERASNYKQVESVNNVIQLTA